MRVIGVGVDIIKNARMTDLLTKPHSQRFLLKVLHQTELAHFETITDKTVQGRFLASRWAVKEATVKALSRKQLHFPGVNIIKDSLGKPSILLSGDINEKILRELSVKEFHMSIAHEDQYSIAYVMAFT